MTGQRETLGAFIERRRLAAGYTSRTRLAKAAGVSEATIRRLIAGHGRPEKETLEALARVAPLAVTYTELLIMAGLLPPPENTIEEPLTAQERETLRLLRQLPDDLADIYLRLLRALTARNAPAPPSPEN